MSKIYWLIPLFLIGACGDGDNTETGPCYYSPQVEVPRADYDAAAGDGELSPAACESLCNEHLDPEDSGGPAMVTGPECVVEEVGAELVSMRCQVETGCA